VEEFIELAREQFGDMTPEAMWSDMREWQEPKGFLWSPDGVKTERAPEEVQATGYVPESVAKYFFRQASNGARDVKHKPDGSGHKFRWASVPEAETAAS
jgi:hypothetical protein